MASLPSITDIFVIFNNHFRGFSPADVNYFKAQMNLSWKTFELQKNLTDFFDNLSFFLQQYKILFTKFL